VCFAAISWRCHEYLVEENHVLREQLGDQRVRLDDHQRRRRSVAERRMVSGVTMVATLARMSRPSDLPLKSGARAGVEHRPRGMVDDEQHVVRHQSGSGFPAWDDGGETGVASTLTMGMVPTIQPQFAQHPTPTGLRGTQAFGEPAGKQRGSAPPTPQDDATTLLLK
jgi:hypothetical protein